jgi:hypothetical protein
MEEQVKAMHFNARLMVKRMNEHARKTFVEQSMKLGCREHASARKPRSPHLES